MVKCTECREEHSESLICFIRDELRKDPCMISYECMYITCAPWRGPNVVGLQWHPGTVEAVCAQDLPRAPDLDGRVAVFHCSKLAKQNSHTSQEHILASSGNSAYSWEQSQKDFWLTEKISGKQQDVDRNGTGNMNIKLWHSTYPF